MKSSAAALLLLLSGCAELAPKYFLNLRALGPATPPGADSAGVLVAASAVTHTSWRDHHAVEVRLEWNEINNSGYARGDLNSQTLFTPGLLPERGEVSLVPLPSFEVRIINNTQAPLSLAGADLYLEDERGHKFPWIKDVLTIRRRAETELFERHPSLALPSNRVALNAFHDAQNELPLLVPELSIPPGGDWQGYALFDLEVHDVGAMQAFMTLTQELRLRIAHLAPDGTELVFHFPVLRKPRSTARLDSYATDPIENGPCIQQTRKLRSLFNRQWWMGGAPIADSDLHRTLLRQSISRAQMKRGLLLRGVGYALTGAGLLSTSVGAVVIANTEHGSFKPEAAGALGFLGLSAVGIVLTIVGTRHSNEAVRLYNEQSEATGLCAPVW
jgi:hypothetical protein